MTKSASGIGRQTKGSARLAITAVTTSTATNFARGDHRCGAVDHHGPAPLPAPGDKLELPGKYSLRLKNRKDDTADYSCKISKVYTSTHLLDRVDKETRLSITGHKGYRLSRATHAVPCGDWYYEVSVELNDGGAV